jgi:branched-chain amino acid transport system substrate-binding protein
MPFNIAFGYLTKKAYDVIIPVFNEAGGLVVGGQRYNLDMTIYDDAYNADTGLAYAEKLISEDGVRYFVGMVGSGPAKAQIKVTDPAKVIFIGDCLASDFLAPEYKYTFRGGESPLLQPAKWGFVTKCYPDAKTVGIIGPDNESGHAQADIFVKVCKVLGQTPLEPIFYPYDAKDFTALATKLVSLNPDLITFASGEGGASLGLQLKALYEAGYKGHCVSVDPVYLDQIKQVAPSAAIEGLVTRVNAESSPNPPAILTKFMADYTKKYGKWESMSYGFISCFWAFTAAVEKADSLDPDKIAAAFKGLEFDSPQGHCIMLKRPDLGQDRYCDCAVPYYFATVTNGKLVYAGMLTAEECIKTTEAFYGIKFR